ncbi:Sensor protein ZraS [Aquisphaera giovannonii]|uniref:histidine kinase n=1 Tax=Aquisphaera giovannonii TaxID=406548 RepID=A0A5B9WDN5_9BACT|nr:ATP-binding protein [Aquisphaera giovannonii]QEH38185.1 Sensor protein ZraS [Aquisphaera giovannonii]
MVRWPIRVKLVAGLSVVVGMMLILLGGSAFGLHCFHISYLTQSDQLHEMGASVDLIDRVFRLQLHGEGTPEERQVLVVRVLEARDALLTYFRLLKENTVRGNRANSGLDELGLAFRIDDDLTAVLAELSPEKTADPVLPGTSYYVNKRPDLLPQMEPAADLKSRLARLNRSVMLLPKELFGDFNDVLVLSKGQYLTSRAIVWTSALMVMAMLGGLMMLFHHWVLYPVRLLQRGVRRVARGSFDYKIELKTGDEMQDLAEAFNDMTAKISLTYADLEQQVNERSRQLVRSERLAGVGFLAAGVAHEINNPLASIAFCSEALESRVGGLMGASDHPDHRVIQNYLKMIQEEAFRCKNITEKLLDFSRCNDIQRERTDLAGLIQGVVDMIRHIGKYRGKAIAFHPKEAVMAHVDGQEIKQVVLNLVVNALDSMEVGGVLRIEARYSHGMAEMVFADGGCGMPPDVLENIFEPFFTRRRVGKGTGLGLSITHRIVSQHHGEIMASSPGEGMGSTFKVRLPIHPSEVDEGRAAREATAPRAAGLAFAG